MDRIEAEWRETCAFEDIEVRIVEHISLVHASPAAHVSCSSRILSLVEDTETSLRRSIKPEGRVTLVREAVRLVDRGVGVSEQLRALNALYRVLRDTDSDKTSRLTLVGRIHSLVLDTGHRIPTLSWLGTERRPVRQTSSQDGSTLAWDAMARLESETIPGLQWVNPGLLDFNECHKGPDTMADFHS
ncbi:hypothetical protein FRC11_001818, partial [Ceratobasidium sp. 423]